MKLLLDTHVFVWSLTRDRRLGEQARLLIETDASEVIVSVLALWEIALKASLGRMPVDAAQANIALAASGFRRLDLSAAHVLAFAQLPFRPDHRDPFDRMLLAQAQHEGLTLMTDDAKLTAYGMPTLGCA